MALSEKKMPNSKKIYLAPLQSFTNVDYRNLFEKYFDSVDKYYSPYLRFEPRKKIKESILKDILPENNEKINLVPQLLGTDVDLFIDWINRMEDWGYKEVNWNLGCPFPMVTGRGFGAALIREPEKVKAILDVVFEKINISLSIKCRLGFKAPEEIHSLLEILNLYPIKELTIHARTAKQMYKGKANPQALSSIISESKLPLVYNGDIQKTTDIEQLSVMFDDKIDAFMIGRALLKNPFLASEIKGKFLTKKEKRSVLESFHSEFLQINKQKLEPSHLLGRMQMHWEYLSFVFENQHKIYKSIKKTKRIDKYEILIDKIMQEENIL